MNEERWGAEFSHISPPVQVSAKMVLDSISPVGRRICSMQLYYPRMVHSELMTHRTFSRSASSSRAVPTEKIISSVETEAAVPYAWGKNCAGMQASESLHADDEELAHREWFIAKYYAVRSAKAMASFGVHKQAVNRVLEPFAHISVIVTSTEWSNFFMLRDHPDADPTMQALARVMRKEMADSSPTVRLHHLPYVGEYEFEYLPHCPSTDAYLVSAARCARVSYLAHDATEPSKKKDLALAAKLLTQQHMSPFEHQAVWNPNPTAKSANFVGWEQHRTLLEKQIASTSSL